MTRFTFEHRALIAVAVAAVSATAHAGFAQRARHTALGRATTQAEVHTVQEATVHPFQPPLVPNLVAHTVQEDLSPVPDPDRDRDGTDDSRLIIDRVTKHQSLIEFAGGVDRRAHVRKHWSPKAGLALRLPAPERSRGDATQAMGPPVPAPGASVLMVLAGALLRRGRRRPE